MILNYVWISLGVLFFIWPQSLRWWTGRRANREMKWPILFLILWVGFNLAHWVWGFPEMKFRLVGLVILIILLNLSFKALFSASSKFLSWWSSLPLLAFRFIGLLFVGIGVWGINA